MIRIIFFIRLIAFADSGYIWNFKNSEICEAEAKNKNIYTTKHPH